MNFEVELDGTRYIRIGSDWVDASTFIKPPHVIIQRLNQQLPIESSTAPAARAAKPVARTSRRLGLEFTGLQDHDFQRGTTNTNWRSRTNLGGLLARQLSDKTAHDFLSYAVYRRAQVYVAIPERFGSEDKFPAAKFDFRLDEARAQYGFYIEKRDKPMDATWDWTRLLPALTNDAQLRDHLQRTTRQFDLRWCLEISQDGNQERYIQVTGHDPLTWQETGLIEQISWPTFLQRLTMIESERWCDLRLCGFMEKAQAMAAGTDIANQVVTIFQELIPLYEAVTQPLSRRRPLPTARDAVSTFTHDELFPIIADIIHRKFRLVQAFVTHDEIVSGLLEHPEGRDLVMTARERQGDEKPLVAIAANMVAWFSQRITTHTSDYQDIFQRQQIDGKWAYRPVQGRPDPP